MNSSELQQMPSRQNEIAALSKRLAPATTDELAKRLAVLFAALPTFNSGDDELRTRAYLLALKNVSAETLSAAVARVLEGTAKLGNPRFAPTPPELATICREIDAWDRARLHKLREQSRDERPMPSPEERARIAAKAEATIAMLDRTAGDDPLKREQASGVKQRLEEIAAAARSPRPLAVR